MKKITYFCSNCQKECEPKNNLSKWRIQSDHSDVTVTVSLSTSGDSDSTYCPSCLTKLLKKFINTSYAALHQSHILK